MKNISYGIRNFLIFTLLLTSISVCPSGLYAQDDGKPGQIKVRRMVDTIGFPNTAEKLDRFMNYIEGNENDLVKKTLDDAGMNETLRWKTVICPHDDYTYVGYLYPSILRNIHAKTVIIIGVCHKARQYNLENKLIFDSYTQWKTPYGSAPVSEMRDKIIKQLDKNIYEVNDEVQSEEHSVEAVVPVLQYYNKDVEIISILVPYASYGVMNDIAKSLSLAIQETALRSKLEWGKDFALVISSDAVHYGDEDWGGKNYADYGVDSAGYCKAVNHEHEIMSSCLEGKILPEKIRKFTSYTVSDDDFKEYKWTWCGRYSVPFGLLTTYYLQELYGDNLKGAIVKYVTSIDHPQVPVSETRMGVTAPANNRHWVGYAAIGYR